MVRTLLFRSRDPGSNVAIVDVLKRWIPDWKDNLRVPHIWEVSKKKHHVLLQALWVKLGERDSMKVADGCTGKKSQFIVI